MKNKRRVIASLSSNSVFLGILLAIVGGFLDAYTYVSRDGVFANAQTGNMVLLGIRAAQGEWKETVRFIPPILAFILGVLVAETVKIPRVRAIVYSYRRFVLILECIVLFIVGALPESVPNMVVTVCIAFVSSMQISTFNKLDKWNYNSTVTTGNLRTATQAAYSAIVERDQEAKNQFKEFISIILCFLLGALTGTYLTMHIGDRAIWIASALLIISILLYHSHKGYFRRSKKAMKLDEG